MKTELQKEAKYYLGKKITEIYEDDQMNTKIRELQDLIFNNLVYKQKVEDSKLISVIDEYIKNTSKDKLNSYYTEFTEDIDKLLKARQEQKTVKYKHRTKKKEKVFRDFIYMHVYKIFTNDDKIDRFTFLKIDLLASTFYNTMQAKSKKYVIKFFKSKTKEQLQEYYQAVCMMKINSYYDIINSACLDLNIEEIRKVQKSYEKTLVDISIEEYNARDYIAYKLHLLYSKNRQITKSVLFKMDILLNEIFLFITEDLGANIENYMEIVNNVFLENQIEELDAHYQCIKEENGIPDDL